LGLAGHSAVEILARAFYSLHDTLRPVAIGLGAMALNIALSLLLGRPAEQGGMAHAGLALANSVATLLEMCVLVGMLSRRAGGLPWRDLALSAGRIVAASLLMGIVLWSVVFYLEGMGAWVVAGVGIVAGGLTFLLAAFLLRAPEPAALFRMLRRPK